MTVGINCPKNNKVAVTQCTKWRFVPRKQKSNSLAIKNDNQAKDKTYVKASAKRK